MNRLIPIVGVVGLTFLIVYTLFLNHSDFCYDEPYYLHNVTIFDQNGLSRDFIEKLWGPAGPLYAVIHWILRPLTNLDIQATRSVNLVLLVLVVCLMYILLNKINPKRKFYAMLFFSIPMTYPTSGLALTEVPAMLFYAAAMLTLVLAFESALVFNQWSIVVFFLGGLFMSFAILGRQPYLLTLGAFAVIPLFKLSIHIKIGVLVFVLASLILPVSVFSMWKGLVPQIGGNIATAKFLEPTHLLLSLGYSFLVMLILGYGFFIKPTKVLLVIHLCLFVAFIPLCYLFQLSYTPVATFNKNYMSPDIFNLYGYAMAAAIMVLGIYFLYSFVIRMTQYLSDIYYIIFGLMLFALIFSSIAVTHQFSSRYVFQAAPLFILIASYHHKENDKVAIGLFSLGLLLGMITLISYC